MVDRSKELKGYSAVASGGLRAAIVVILAEGPQGSSSIALRLRVPQSRVAKPLHELLRADLVLCSDGGPDFRSYRKGRVFNLTELGTEVSTSARKNLLLRDWRIEEDGRLIPPRKIGRRNPPRR